MNITEEDWTQLESQHHPAGVVTRRLFPRSAHDIFLAVQQPTGRRMLVLRAPADAAETALRRHGPLPSTRGLALQYAPAGGGLHELQVILTLQDLREVFTPLITDMAESAQAAPDTVEALTIAVQRFQHWRDLLQSINDSGLDPEARRGLYGELAVLRGYVLPVLPPDQAVAAWTGPDGGDQDLQLPSCAIEVKTSSGRQPQTIQIASERQLDDAAVAVLLLAHLSMDERRGGSGESLNTIIESVRQALGPSSTARAALDNQLVRAGYLTHQRSLYDEPRYTIRETRFWHVTGEFPRIVESDLRSGVGDCHYRLSTVGLDRYRVTADEVLRIAKGAL